MAIYRSPTGDPIRVCLLSGHAIEVGPEGREVPDMFISHVLAAGALLGKRDRKEVEKTKNSKTGLKPGEEPPSEQSVIEAPVNPSGVSEPEYDPD